MRTVIRFASLFGGTAAVALLAATAAQAPAAITPATRPAAVPATRPAKPLALPGTRPAAPSTRPAAPATRPVAAAHAAAPTKQALTTVRTLDRKLPDLSVEGVALHDAVDFFRDVTGANVNVNWRALAEANVARDAPITLHLVDVKIGKVLQLLLDQVAPDGSLTYVVDDGVIEITTREQADRQLITRLYPIQDLLVDVPDFTNAPSFDLRSTSGGGGGGGRGGSGSGGSSGGLFSDTSSRQQEPVKTKEEKAQEIIDMIVSTVRPEIWAQNGGTASIKLFQGNLIITAPRSVHRAIGG